MKPSSTTPESEGWWDEWRGSLDGRPTFWLKRLLYLPVWRKAGKWHGCRVDLHKFIAADDDGCFHSHPAYAIRIVLWGGYVEEIYEDGKWGLYKTWFPGMVGLVKPPFAHRIQGLVNGRASYSLWLRGPIVAPVKLLGDGWPVEYQGGISPQGGKS